MEQIYTIKIKVPKIDVRPIDKELKKQELEDYQDAFNWSLKKNIKDTMKEILEKENIEEIFFDEINALSAIEDYDTFEDYGIEYTLEIEEKEEIENEKI